MINNETIRQPGPKPRECGCKGIRSCRLCEATGKSAVSQDDCHSKALRAVFEYCLHCGAAWKTRETCLTSQNSADADGELESQGNPKSCTGRQNADEFQTHNSSKDVMGNGTSDISSFSCETRSQAGHCHHDSESVKDFEGIFVIENFVTKEEEQFLATVISESQFVNSQSGRRKQDYGPKVNFKKQKLRTANFTGLPSYSRFLYERMKSYPCLHNFEPVELCNLEYCQERGAHIDPHFDDAWLWGERLVTLNILSDSTLTFTLDSNPELEVRVPLLQRSLIVVSSAARYRWKHSIHSRDIGEKRIAMTFRELSREFCSGGDREQEGLDLITLALTFEGRAVGS